MWYIVPDTKNYRCFKFSMASTEAEGVSETIRFDHHAVSIPAFTLSDIIVAETKHPTDVIRQQPTTALPEELAAVH